MIFITGSESFVGTNLIRRLKKEKIKFIGIDTKKTSKNSNLKIRNINDPNLYKLIPKNSTIVHLAAISNVKDCESNPMKTLKTNINGTLNLIEQSVKKKARHFIFASTEWVYPNEKKVFNENSSIQIEKLDNNYSISKLIGENIIKKFSKKIKITILRFGIIYSDRISSGSAVEALTNSVLNSKEVKIGSKLNSRRFVHIDDIVNGIYLSYKKKIQGTFNLAGDKDINLGEIINLSKKILNKNVTIVESKKTKPSIRKVSNLQAKTKLGWRPKISIYEGIQKIIKRKI